MRSGAGGREVAARRTSSPLYCPVLSSPPKCSGPSAAFTSSRTSDPGAVWSNSGAAGRCIHGERGRRPAGAGRLTVFGRGKRQDGERSRVLQLRIEVADGGLHSLAERVIPSDDLRPGAGGKVGARTANPPAMHTISCGANWRSGSQSGAGVPSARLGAGEVTRWPVNRWAPFRLIVHFLVPVLAESTAGIHGANVIDKRIKRPQDGRPPPPGPRTPAQTGRSRSWRASRADAGLPSAQRRATRGTWRCGDIERILCDGRPVGGCGSFRRSGRRGLRWCLSWAERPAGA